MATNNNSTSAKSTPAKDDEAKAAAAKKAAADKKAAAEKKKAAAKKTVTKAQAEKLTAKDIVGLTSGKITVLGPKVKGKKRQPVERKITEADVLSFAVNDDATELTYVLSDGSKHTAVIE